MTVRELERLLVSLGAPRSFLDVVTRGLREAGELPVTGHGRFAATIGASHAAIILAALAGADVATNADLAFQRQSKLYVSSDREPRVDRNFVSAMELILADRETASSVLEVRVGVTHARSSIVYKNGDTEDFVQAHITIDKACSIGARSFRSEGVLGGALLHAVATALIGVETVMGGQTVG